MTSADAFNPGQPLLSAALPIPISGMSLLADVADRLYGVGSVVRQEGSYVTLAVPSAGTLGPRAAGPLPEREDTGEQLLTAQDTEDGIEMTYELAQHSVGIVAAALARWFTHSGGINYVTAAFADPAGSPLPYRVTVRRGDRPTPEQLHLTALDRIAQLEQQIREAGLTPIPEEN